MIQLYFSWFSQFKQLIKQKTRIKGKQIDRDPPKMQIRLCSLQKSKNRDNKFKQDKVSLIKSLFCFLFFISRVFEADMQAEKFQQSVLIYVLKDSNRLNAFKQENITFKQLSLLKNPNLKTCIYDFYNKSIQLGQTTYDNVCGVIFEKSHGKNLLNLEGNIMSENVARRLFLPIINTVNFMHENGFAHRDLRLDNIYVTNQRIEITGLGKIKPKQLNELSKFLISLVNSDSLDQNQIYAPQGSLDYISPQNLCRENLNAQQLISSDLYSLGICLFIIVIGQPPFSRTQDRFKFLETLLYQEKAKFWNIFSNYMEKNGKNLSNSFINLIDGLLEKDPSRRFQMKDIFLSDWFQLPFADDDQFQNQLLKRL